MNLYLVGLARPSRVAAALVLAAAAVALAPAPASAAVADLRLESQWSTGYVARMTVRNDTAAPLTAWRVEFDLPSGTAVSSHWSASLTSSGNRHTFVSLPWNGSLAPGAETSFGWVASGTGTPSNCTINGAPCAGGPTGPDVRPPGTPPNLRLVAGQPQTFNLAWDPATDDHGVVGYEVFANGNRIATTTGTFYTGPIPPPMIFAYGVRAVDAAGNVSPFAFYGLGTPVDTQPPTTPTGLSINFFNANNLIVRWTASTDNVMVAGYEVVLNGQLISLVGGTSAVVPYRGFGVYFADVRAFDGAGNYSPAARLGIAIDPPPPTTPPAPPR